MTTYLAESDTILEPLHEVVNVNVEVRVEALQPLGQIFLHGVQILLAGLERPERSRVQQHHTGLRTVVHRDAFQSRHFVFCPIKVVGINF